MIDKVFLILMLGVSFANFLFIKIDMWHAQGTWVQLGIIGLYFLHLFKKSKPLASLFLWISLFTTFIWFVSFKETNKYPTTVLLTYFNFLSIVILFDLITKYINKETYCKVMKYLPFCLVLILVYCILQKFNLDQFYRDLSTITFPDPVVGTIGNSFHLSHYICILMPCLFLLKQPLNKLGILLALGIILLTGSTSGLFIALSVIFLYSLFFKIFNIKEVILAVLIVILFCIIEYKSLYSSIQLYTTDSGRFAIWKEYLPIFKEKPITGWGLGTINIFSQKMPQVGWRHLHNEFYHFTIEIGLIGLGLIIWGIVDYFKRIVIKDKLSIAVACMFFAFCLSSLIGYPGHLWLLSIFGIFAYSYQYLEA